MTPKPDQQRSGVDASPEATTDRAALRFVQWLFAALAGGSFASILFILGQGWSDPPVLGALGCFVAALPLFSGAVLVYGEPRPLYHATKLFGLIPISGAVLFVAGMTLLIGRAHTIIAGLFVVVVVMQLLVVSNAHHRHRMRARANPPVSA